MKARMSTNTATTTQYDGQKVEQPEYEDLTPEQREEYYQFSAALVTWLKANANVRVSWGWTPVGKFLLVIGVRDKNVSLDVKRDIEQDELWDLLDGTVRPKTSKAKPANDDWDW